MSQTPAGKATPPKPSSKKATFKDITTPRKPARTYGGRYTRIPEDVPIGPTYDDISYWEPLFMDNPMGGISGSWFTFWSNSGYVGHRFVTTHSYAGYSTSYRYYSTTQAAVAKTSKHGGGSGAGSWVNQAYQKSLARDTAPQSLRRTIYGEYQDRVDDPVFQYQWNPLDPFSTTRGTPDTTAEFISQLPNWAKAAIGEDVSFSPYEPDWARQMREVSYFGFLAGNLAPSYTMSIFKTAYRAGWLPTGMMPQPDAGFGMYTYEGRAEEAEARIAGYQYGAAHSKSLAMLNQMWASYFTVSGKPDWAKTATERAEYYQTLVDYNTMADGLWNARLGYWNFEQQWAPISAVYTGLRLASFITAAAIPQSFLLRAFGFTIYGPAHQIGAAQAQAPGIAQAISANASEALQRVQTNPMFWPYQTQDLASELGSSLGEWTFMQMLIWGIKGGPYKFFPTHVPGATDVFPDIPNLAPSQPVTIAQAVAGVEHGTMPLAPVQPMLESLLPGLPEYQKLTGIGELPALETSVRLWRGQGTPSGTSNLPDWIKQRIISEGVTEAQGRWFARTPEQARWYIEDSPTGGILKYVDVPRSIAEKFSVKNIPEVMRFSLDPTNEWFLPREWADRAGIYTDPVALLSETPKPLGLPDLMTGYGGPVPPGYTRLYRATVSLPSLPDVLESPFDTELYRRSQASYVTRGETRLEWSDGIRKYGTLDTALKNMQDIQELGRPAKLSYVDVPEGIFKPDVFGTYAIPESIWSKGQFTGERGFYDMGGYQPLEWRLMREGEIFDAATETVTGRVRYPVSPLASGWLESGRAEPLVTEWKTSWAKNYGYVDLRTYPITYKYTFRDLLEMKEIFTDVPKAVDVPASLKYGVYNLKGTKEITLEGKYWTVEGGFDQYRTTPTQRSGFWKDDQLLFEAAMYEGRVPTAEEAKLLQQEYSILERSYGKTTSRSQMKETLTRMREIENLLGTDFPKREDVLPSQLEDWMFPEAVDKYTGLPKESLSKIPSERSWIMGQESAVWGGPEVPTKPSWMMGQRAADWYGPPKQKINPTSAWEQAVEYRISMSSSWLPPVSPTSWMDEAVLYQLDVFGVRSPINPVSPFDDAVVYMQDMRRWMNRPTVDALQGSPAARPPGIWKRMGFKETVKGAIAISFMQAGLSIIGTTAAPIIARYLYNLEYPNAKMPLFWSEQEEREFYQGEAIGIGSTAFGVAYGIKSGFFTTMLNQNISGLAGGLGLSIAGGIGGMYVGQWIGERVEDAAAAVDQSTLAPISITARGGAPVRTITVAEQRQSLEYWKQYGGDIGATAGEVLGTFALPMAVAALAPALATPLGLAALGGYVAYEALMDPRAAPYTVEIMQRRAQENPWMLLNPVNLGITAAIEAAKKIGQEGGWEFPVLKWGDMIPPATEYNPWAFRVGKFQMQPTRQMQTMTANAPYNKMIANISADYAAQEAAIESQYGPIRVQVPVKSTRLGLEAGEYDYVYSFTGRDPWTFKYNYLLNEIGYYNKLLASDFTNAPNDWINFKYSEVAPENYPDLYRTMTKFQAMAGVSIFPKTKEEKYEYMKDYWIQKKKELSQEAADTADYMAQRALYGTVYGVFVNGMNIYNFDTTQSNLSKLDLISPMPNVKVYYPGMTEPTYMSGMSYLFHDLRTAIVKSEYPGGDIPDDAYMRILPSEMLGQLATRRSQLIDAGYENAVNEFTLAYNKSRSMYNYLAGGPLSATAEWWKYNNPAFPALMAGSPWAKYYLTSEVWNGVTLEGLIPLLGSSKEQEAMIEAMGGHAGPSLGHYTLTQMPGTGSDWGVILRVNPASLSTQWGGLLPSAKGDVPEAQRWLTAGLGQVTGGMVMPSLVRSYMGYYGLTEPTPMNWGATQFEHEMQAAVGNEQLMKAFMEMGVPSTSLAYLNQHWNAQPGGFFSYTPEAWGFGYVPGISEMLPSGAISPKQYTMLTALGILQDNMLPKSWGGFPVEPVGSTEPMTWNALARMTPSMMYAKWGMESIGTRTGTGVMRFADYFETLEGYPMYAGGEQPITDVLAKYKILYATKTPGAMGVQPQRLAPEMEYWQLQWMSHPNTVDIMHRASLGSADIKSTGLGTTGVGFRVYSMDSNGNVTVQNLDSQGNVQYTGSISPNAWATLTGKGGYVEGVTLQRPVDMTGWSNFQYPGSRIPGILSGAETRPVDVTSHLALAYTKDPRNWTDIARSLGLDLEHFLELKVDIDNWDTLSYDKQNQVLDKLGLPRAAGEARFAGPPKPGAPGTATSRMQRGQYVGQPDNTVLAQHGYEGISREPTVIYTSEYGQPESISITPLVTSRMPRGLDLRMKLEYEGTDMSNIRSAPSPMSMMVERPARHIEGSVESRMYPVIQKMIKDQVYWLSESGQILSNPDSWDFNMRNQIVDGIWSSLSLALYDASRR